MDSLSSLLNHFIAPLAIPRPQLQVGYAPVRLLLGVPLAWLAGRVTPVKARTAVLGFLEGTFERKALFISRLVVLAVFLETALVAYAVFLGQPHTPDEIVYSMMGKYFAAGQMYVAKPYFFDFFHVQNGADAGNRWFGKFHPGYPLVLAVGMKMGLGPLVNPTLTALTLGLMVAWARRRFTPGVAALAAIFALLSPFIVFMGGGFLSHPAAAFFLMLAVWAGCPAPGGSPRLGLTGASLGAAFLARPLTAVAMGIPIAWVAIFSGLKGPFQAKGAPGKVMKLALAGGVFVLGYLWYNHVLTGDFLQFPFNLNHPGDKIGFGAAQREFGVFGPSKGGVLSEHTPAQGVVNSLIQITALSIHLFGFPFLSLLPLLWSPRRGSGFLWLMPAMVLAFYATYWDHSATSPFGPRYVYETFPFLLILAARGLLSQTTKTREKGAFAPTVLLVLFVQAGMGFWPLMTRYFYWNSVADLRPMALVAAQGLQRAVIFSGRYDDEGFAHNSADFNGPLLFVRDLGVEKDSRFLRSKAGAPGFRVVEVPPPRQSKYPPFPGDLEGQIGWYRKREVRLERAQILDLVPSEGKRNQLMGR